MGNFNILPQDIVLDILTRLPNESVLECKLVCKPWRNLVDLPCFSRLHLSRLTNAGKLTFLGEDIHQQLNYIEYNENHHEHSIRRVNLSPPFGKGYTIIGSCNGLICVDACHDSDYKPAYICNPYMREYVILPKYNRYRDFKTYHLYDGFGYLPETNEYKVVRIDQLRGKPNLECVEVYTLGSGSGWRNVGDFGLSSSMGFFSNSQGVFVRDSLYWITSEGKIACFDLADEKFCEIPALPFLVSGMFRIIGALDGLLWCSQIFIQNGCIRKTDMWFLKKNRSQNMMEQEEYLSLKGREIFDVKPLAFMKSGEVLCYNPFHLYSYDIKSSCYKRLVDFPQHLFHIIPHMDTLVSLKALGEEDTKPME